MNHRHQYHRKIKIYLQSHTRDLRTIRIETGVMLPFEVRAVTHGEKRVLPSNPPNNSPTMSRVDWIVPIVVFGDGFHVLRVLNH